MKKTQTAIICILSIFVLALASNATAYNADYTHTNYQSTTIPTIDGQYTYGDDWAASLVEPFGTNGFFRDEWTMTPTYYCLLIETTDATNDAGDYWEVTFDSTTEGAMTPPNGGTAPQTDDFKIVFTGHGVTATAQWYQGNGAGWNAIDTPTEENFFVYAQSLSSSPMIAGPHYILEIRILKTSTTLGMVPMGYNWASYYAYYDEHEGGNGLQSWPPTPATPTNPNSWGYIPYESGANPTPDVPEGFGTATILALFTVTAITGAVLLRKKTKINISPTSI